jgi:hypothetical protein
MTAPSTSSPGTEVHAPGAEVTVDRLAYRHRGNDLGERLVIHYARY